MFTDFLDTAASDLFAAQAELGQAMLKSMPILFASVPPGKECAGIARPADNATLQVSCGMALLVLDSAFQHPITTTTPLHTISAVGLLS